MSEHLIEILSEKELKEWKMVIGDLLALTSNLATKAGHEFTPGEASVRQRAMSLLGR